MVGGKGGQTMSLAQLNVPLSISSSMRSDYRLVGGKGQLPSIVACDPLISLFNQFLWRRKSVTLILG